VKKESLCVFEFQKWETILEKAEVAMSEKFTPMCGNRESTENKVSPESWKKWRTDNPRAAENPQNPGIDGEKHDHGKPRLHMLPRDVLIELTRVYEYGADKYGGDNWVEGFRSTRLSDALERHLWAWMHGEDRDSESGLMHLNHVLWNAMTLLAQELRGTGTDDRRTVHARDESAHGEDAE